MKTKIAIGNSAYFCATSPNMSMDLLLSPGRSVEQSVQNSIDELRLDSAKLLARAEFLELALKQYSEV